MKFRLNGVHIAYVKDELISKYRELYNISTEVIDDHHLIRKILYNNILHIEFEPDNVDATIEMIKKISQYHCFKNTGEYIEYHLHRKIEKKIFTCEKCEKYDKETGECFADDNFCKVFPTYNYCVLNEEKEKMQQEALDFLNSLSI